MANKADQLWAPLGATPCNTAAIIPAPVVTTAITQPAHSCSLSPAHGCSSTTPGPRPRVCFYHARFGSKAMKCQPPCSHQGMPKAAATSLLCVRQLPNLPLRQHQWGVLPCRHPRYLQCLALLFSRYCQWSCTGWGRWQANPLMGDTHDIPPVWKYAH